MAVVSRPGCLEPDWSAIATYCARSVKPRAGISMDNSSAGKLSANAAKTSPCCVDAQDEFPFIQLNISLVLLSRLIAFRRIRKRRTVCKGLIAWQFSQRQVTVYMAPIRENILIPNYKPPVKAKHQVLMQECVDLAKRDVRWKQQLCSICWQNIQIAEQSSGIMEPATSAVKKFTISISHWATRSCNTTKFFIRQIKVGKMYRSKLPIFK